VSYRNAANTVVVSCCCQKLVAEVGDSYETQEPLKAVIRKLVKTQQVEKT
jgi:hypothetical protein